jgi:general secretion pathway protein A
MWEDHAMLINYYGFSEKPFELLPDLTFLYSTNGYRTALEAVSTGINERKGLMILTGEVGTGKTMVIHGVLEGLPEEVKTAFIFHSTFEFTDLLKQILYELGETSAFEEAQELKKPFLEYLKDIREKGELLTVLIDEAQLIPRNVVVDLFHIFELEPWISETLQLVLAGQPEFMETYHDALSKHRPPRPPQEISLEPLSAKESLDYIESRLRRVGKCSDEIFSSQAISLIIEKAGGIPRIINNICDNALYNGYNASVKIIGIDIIKKVIRNLDGENNSPGLEKKASRRGSFLNLFRNWRQYPRFQQMPQQ